MNQNSEAQFDKCEDTYEGYRPNCVKSGCPAKVGPHGIHRETSAYNDSLMRSQLIMTYDSFKSPVRIHQSLCSSHWSREGGGEDM